MGEDQTRSKSAEASSAISTARSAAAAGAVVELERVDPCDAQVGERQLRRGPSFSSTSRALGSRDTRRPAGRAPTGSDPGGAGLAASMSSPSSSSCPTPSARSCSPAVGSPFNQRRWPIRASSDACSCAPVTCRSTRSRSSAASLNAIARSASSAARRHASTASPFGRAQQMPRDSERAPVGAQERVGGPGVDPLPFRNDRVARDRLLRERVAPDVALARLGLLLEELRDRRLERGEHGSLVGLGHLEEQPVVERSAEHGGGPQNLDPLGVEPSQAQQHGLAHGLRHPQRLDRARRQPSSVARSRRGRWPRAASPRARTGFSARSTTRLASSALVCVQDRPDHLGRSPGSWRAPRPSPRSPPRRQI